jgi:hypothetical protein
MAESVIATIKSELTGRPSRRTRLDLELALLTYIGWYNQRRLHRSLGGRTPNQVAAAYGPPAAESDEEITTKTNSIDRRVVCYGPYGASSYSAAIASI